MNKSRLEAFSDGVFAIIITISVLQMQIPRGSDWNSLKSVFPIFLTYIFSFTMVGIYWNNHHHLFQAVHATNGRVLWANLFLLFWLSLFPFATGWMGNNHFSEIPVMTFAVILFMAAFAFSLLLHSIIKIEGKDSLLAKAVKRDRKGNLSLGIYFLSFLLSFYYPLISVALFVLVAIIWFIPDRRIEKNIDKKTV